MIKRIYRRISLEVIESGLILKNEKKLLINNKGLKCVAILSSTISSIEINYGGVGEGQTVHGI